MGCDDREMTNCVRVFLFFRARSFSLSFASRSSMWSFGQFSRNKAIKDIYAAKTAQLELGGQKPLQGFFLSLANQRGFLSSTFHVPCAFFLSNTRPGVLLMCFVLSLQPTWTVSATSVASRDAHALRIIAIYGVVYKFQMRNEAPHELPLPPAKEREQIGVLVVRSRSRTLCLAHKGREKEDVYF